MAIQQRVYEWAALLDDIVLGSGEKHAKDDVQLEKYIKAVLLPKYPQATSWTYKQLYCDDCGDGENDVTAFYYPGREERHVKCFNCRNKRFLSRNYGTVKKGDIGL